MQKTGFEKLKKFFSLIPHHKKDFFIHFLQSIIRGLSPIIHIFFIERIVFGLSEKNLEFVQNMLIYYIVALLFFEFLWIVTRKVGWIITLAKSEATIYDRYLKKFIQMDNNEVEKIGIGKIIALLENGRLRWGEGLAQVIEKGTSLMILMFYTIVIISKNGVFYTAGFLFLISLSIMVLFYVNKYQFRFRNERSELRNNRLRLITKVLMSKNEILQTGKIQNEINTISDYCDKMSQVNIAMAGGRTAQNRVMPFAIGLSLFLFVYFHFSLVINGEMLLSTFVGITSIFLVVNSSILSFTSFYIDLTKDFIDIEKLWDFFENTPGLEGYEIGENFEYKKGDIYIKNLGYYYYKGKNVLENFSLSLEGGKITALVGMSGSGKTTLVKLIAGYIKATTGEIKIDGQKLSEVSLKSLYQNIGYLTQEPSVFDGSIEENLLYAVEKQVSDEEIKQVIKNANCEFIYDLPAGLHTQIGERGVKLSGGQKQRLAIAKIMLKDPKIIILDEPTSALDSFSEEQITKAMRNLFEGRTVIVIAHRLQTVKHADRIIVLENGKIIEEGKHDELVAKKGQYAKMLDLQSGF